MLEYFEKNERRYKKKLETKETIGDRLEEKLALKNKRESSRPSSSDESSRRLFRR